MVVESAAYTLMFVELSELSVFLLTMAANMLVTSGREWLEGLFYFEKGTTSQSTFFVCTTVDVVSLWIEIKF